MTGDRGALAVAARELEGPPRGVSRWLREVLAASPAEATA